ncbi:hypothetical protein EDC01DRAFT_776854 [Geopyxis carbonaria]|nr:hypothetical protein EDC01DRAFT_776854 [Geopyxis carbonaria]
MPQNLNLHLRTRLKTVWKGTKKAVKALIHRSDGNNRHAPSEEDDYANENHEEFSDEDDETDETGQWNAE